MRHKKLFVLCISIVVIIIASLVSVIKYKTNKQEDFIVMLGNDFSNVKVNTKIDKTFVSNFMESDYLLKIVSQDASKIVEGKVLKMSSLIKKKQYCLYFNWNK